MNSPDQIAFSYRRFADDICGDYSPLYHHLALAVADDEELLRFVAARTVTQPNLLLAAMQYLTGPDHMPRSGADMKTLIESDGHALIHVMETRRTQTNEVGRCASLLPALPSGPLALIEVGASAGLCLLLDRYHYDYGNRQFGDVSSPVRLTCELSGSVPLPENVPQIVWRAGLDRTPVDVHCADDVRWLLSCVFADQPERRQRLEQAIEVARSNAVDVRKGNLLTDLAPLIDDAPSNAQLVVFHSAVLCYVTEEERQTFAETLADLSRQRDIIWLSNESPTVVPEITALSPTHDVSCFLLGRTTFTHKTRQDELLALTHYHGASLDWLESTGKRAEIQKN